MFLKTFIVPSSLKINNNNNTLKHLYANTSDITDILFERNYFI
jgi:hypothetical protein